MNNMSLQELMREYIEYCREDEADFVSYIELFINRAKKTCADLKDIYSSDRAKQIKYPKILSMTPNDILAMSDGRSELSKLICAFIKALPFTERLTAMWQFNQMFSYGGEGDFQFSELKVDPANPYCTIDRLFDQTELEFLILKRIQIDEFSALQRTSQAGIPSNNRQNRDSRVRLADEFNTSTQSLRSYLKRLKRGTNLLGHDVKINLRRSGIDPDYSIHPVFLTLNASEATLLTVDLKERYAESDRREIAERIADDIYSQLSEQLREKIDKLAKERGVSFPENASSLGKLRGYRKERESIELAHKRPTRFDLSFKDDPETMHTGILKGIRDFTYEFKDESGEKQTICSDDIEKEKYIGFE